MCVHYSLTAEDIRRQSEKLLEFHRRFADFFRTSTRKVASHALEYMKGQLLLESRRNMNQMSIKVVEKDNQALSHFISNSPWNDELLIESVAENAVNLLCQSGTQGALILDESGIPKQGEKSVGVARQYCGTLGKVDNCQVGVFLAYSTPVASTLIDRRLYLPSSWIEDSERCEDAGIPKEAREFKTKADFGLEMILGAKQKGVHFEFVGMDGFYGEQPWLLSKLEEEGIIYTADIPCNTRIYLEYPTIGIPKRQGEKGRKPTKQKVLEGKPIEVKTLLTSSSLQWNILKVRDTQRGELRIKFFAMRVWRIENELPCPQTVWLLIRQELDGSDTKFSFSNAKESTPIKTLAEWQSRRYFVERALEDAKGLAGLDEYQVTGWRGWHHHTAMVLLAMLFLLEVKQSLVSQASMITLKDAVDILKVVMPQKELTCDDTAKLIYEKHLNRFRSRNCRLKKQQAEFKKSNFL